MRINRLLKRDEIAGFAAMPKPEPGELAESGESGESVEATPPESSPSSAAQDGKSAGAVGLAKRQTNPHHAMPLPLKALPILEQWDCHGCGMCCRGCPFC